MSLATTWLSNCDSLRHLAANTTFFRRDSEALRNMAWSRSPGRFGLGAALGDGVCLWNHAGRTERHVCRRIDGGIARVTGVHFTLWAIRDRDTVRNGDQ